MFLKAAKGCKLGDFSSVAQSCLTLRPHGLQHTRPPCPSPTPRVYSALTYSIPDLEPVCCSKSSSNCCFLICIQITHEAGQVAWYSHLFQNFPQFVVINTVKDFGVVNKAEVDAFLGLSSFFCDPADVGNVVFGSSAFFKWSLNIWKFMVNVLLKPGLENFEHYFASMWHEYNCVVVWAFFGIAFLWDWNENWPFPVCGQCWVLSQTFRSPLSLSSRGSIVLLHFLP